MVILKILKIIVFSKMKTWKIDLPERDIALIYELISAGRYPSFSQFVRYAILNLILEEYIDRCLYCGRILHYRNQIRRKHKGIKLFQFKFCCRCFERFKNKNLEELPDRVFKNIDRILRKYR